MAQGALASFDSGIGLLGSARFRRQLYSYRAALPRGWSESTAHPDFLDRPDEPASAGQCGVSSAWLLHQLPLHLRLRARYCVGDIFVGDQELSFHCWIEIGRPSAPARWVIDLTCDQFAQFRNQPLICARHRTLARRSIDYRASVWLAERDLKLDPVWHRAQLLAAHMTVWFNRSDAIRNAA